MVRGNGPNIATLVRFSWPFQRVTTVYCFRRNLSATYLHLFFPPHTLWRHRSTNNQSAGCRCRHIFRSVPCRNPCLLLGQLGEHLGISYKLWIWVQLEFSQKSRCLALDLIPLQWNLSNDELQLDGCNCSGFPQTSLKQFQWFFNDISRRKSQISMKILNITKRKNTGPHVTHGLFTIFWPLLGVFKKICRVFLLHLMNNI